MLINVCTKNRLYVNKFYRRPKIVKNIHLKRF